MEPKKFLEASMQRLNFGQIEVEKASLAKEKEEDQKLSHPLTDCCVYTTHLANY